MSVFRIVKEPTYHLLDDPFLQFAEKAERPTMIQRRPEWLVMVALSVLTLVGLTFGIRMFSPMNAKVERAMFAVGLKVIDPSGRPVTGAHIVLAGKTIGATDAYGEWRRFMKVPLGRTLAISVRKRVDGQHWLTAEKNFAVPAALPKDGEPELKGKIALRVDADPATNVATKASVPSAASTVMAAVPKATKPLVEPIPQTIRLIWAPYADKSDRTMAEHDRQLVETVTGEFKVAARDSGLKLAEQKPTMTFRVSLVKNTAAKGTSARSGPLFLLSDLTAGPTGGAIVRAMPSQSKLMAKSLAIAIRQLQSMRSGEGLGDNWEQFTVPSPMPLGHARTLFVGGLQARIGTDGMATYLGLRGILAQVIVVEGGQVIYRGKITPGTSDKVQSLVEYNASSRPTTQLAVSR